ADVSAPVTVGILQPGVLLPESVATWTTAQVESALAHERAHVAARDNLAQLVGAIAVALHWWNPLTWAAARSARAARERAADDAAVLAGIAPVVLAEGILASAREMRARG